MLTLARLERLSCDVLPESLLVLRESATLQSTLPNCKADASHGEARSVAEFWKAHDAWKAGQVK